jgi:hypothetical protein
MKTVVQDMRFLKHFPIVQCYIPEDLYLSDVYTGALGGRCEEELVNYF